MEEKKQHGGKRENAGRPREEHKKIPCPFRVYRELIPEIKKLNDDFTKKIKSQ